MSARFDSKELCFIIFMAVLGLVISVLVVQLATMLTGIPGANYVFTILLAIQTSYSLLMYQGRRWRFFFQMTLYTFLIFPTFIGGVPFDLLSKIHMVINAFFGDLIFNSVYGFFRKQDRLLLWAILGSMIFWVMNPIFGLMIKPFFFPPEFVTKLVDVIKLLSPVILIESIAGGYIGYKIYERTKSFLYPQVKVNKKET